MNIYTLKISLMDFKSVWRWIDISGNCSFDDLHDLLFDAFDRYDEHLYQFFFPQGKANSFRKIYDSPLTIEHPVMFKDSFGGRSSKSLSTCKARLDDVKLSEKQEFYYLFDMGDEWWHKVRVEKIRQDSTIKGRSKVKQITKRKGDSPPQYPDAEEDEGPPEGYELVIEKRGAISVGYYAPNKKKKLA